MVSREYSEAIAETLDILEHTQKSDVDKIPEKFMEFLKENASKTYKPQLDYTKKIKDMNLKDKTIGILSIINKKYWCNDQERKIFEEKLKENEITYQQILNEQYATSDLFKDKKLSEEANEISINLTEYADKKWHQKLFEKILRIFRRNNSSR